MNKKPLSRTAKYYQKVPVSRRHCGNIDIKELIENYRRYECLWNFNSIHYKNKFLKRQAWIKIAKHFGKEVSEVQRKVRYLRTAYVAEKKKVDFSIRTGVVPQYQPILFYYKYFNFLNDIVVWRKGNNDLELEHVEISQDVGDDFINLSKEGLDLPSEQEFSPEPSPSHSSSPPPSPPQQKCKITIPEISSTKTLSPRPPMRKSCTEYKPNGTINGLGVTSNLKLQHNIYSSFGTTISLQLQQLPLDVATETMSEIHSILTRKILTFIKCGQNGQHRPFSLDIEFSDNDLIEVITDDI